MQFNLLKAKKKKKKNICHPNADQPVVKSNVLKVGELE